MAETVVAIEKLSIFDNLTERQVEFRGSVDGDLYDFGVKYSVLEALTGTVPVDQPVAAFAAVRDEIAVAALVALARVNGDALVVIGENDLDQTVSTAPGPQAGPEPDGLPLKR